MGELGTPLTTAVATAKDNFWIGFLVGSLVGGMVGAILATLVAHRQALTALLAASVPPRRDSLNPGNGGDRLRADLEEKIARLNEAIDDIRRELARPGSPQDPTAKG
ncbi:MAG: hypothetical protein SNJ60_08760 [Pseudanabaenaceae cyanobacterium]